ncbi:hypothetical protein PGT21_029408 [Puccinia graminis f. sp. tritici]|uniref:Uncharacterized protein n=1 Tax=Puccinia graminis f. sp. tritici TaxID=56615 RepID=A0A5B0MPP7_PUCGR|nr:hypothetical protein PGT21_029408 [Puccinia graminis f. sp. tritici]
MNRLRLRLLRRRGNVDQAGQLGGDLLVVDRAARIIHLVDSLIASSISFWSAKTSSMFSIVCATRSTVNAGNESKLFNVFVDVSYTSSRLSNTPIRRLRTVFKAFFDLR